MFMVDFNITKIDYIYNLFDIDTIKELSKNDIEIKKRRFTFVTVGRLDNGKNHRSWFMDYWRRTS